MPLLTTTSEQAGQVLAVLIRRVYDPLVRSLVFRNDRLLGLFAKQPSSGDTAHRWKVHTAGNASVAAFAENDAIPVSGSQTYVNADLPFRHWWVRVEFTGHLRAALASNEARIFDAIEAETTRAVTDMVDLITTDSLSATANVGLQFAVDSAGVYAGIDPAVVAGWAAEENNLAVAPATAALTRAAMDEMYRELTDAERAAMPGLILTSPAQVENYNGLTAVPTVFVSTAAPGPAPIDVGYDWKRTSYSGIPIVGIPNLTTTLDDGTTATVMLWLDKEHVQYIEHEPLRTRALGPTRDNDDFLLTMRGIVAVTNRRKQGKIGQITV